MAFRYHQAAASPAASTDAAATTPSLSQPGGAESALCELEEVEDSKEFVIFVKSLFSICRRTARQKEAGFLMLHALKTEGYRTRK
jgi:hypothetical protein